VEWRDTLLGICEVLDANSTFLHTTFQSAYIPRSHEVAVPLAHGIFVVCSKPIYLAYWLNFSLFYGGPLSLTISCGIPNVGKTLSNTGMHAFVDVEETISTIGNRE